MGSTPTTGANMTKKMKVEFAPGFEMPDDPEVKKMLDAFVKKLQSMDAVDMQVVDDTGVIDLGGDIGECEVSKIEDEGTKH